MDAVAELTHAVCADDLNERFGPASPTAVRKVKAEVDEWAASFVAEAPFMILSTASADGACDASPKGGRPGFVIVKDSQTVLIPDYKGNSLFFGLRNILENPQVGMLFMIPGVEWTLRIGGHARIIDDAETLERFRQAAPSARSAQIAIEVTVDECFFHCPKAFGASKLWDGIERRKFDLPPWYSSPTAQAAREGKAFE